MEDKIKDPCVRCDEQEIGLCPECLFESTKQPKT